MALVFLGPTPFNSYYNLKMKDGHVKGVMSYEAFSLRNEFSHQDAGDHELRPVLDELERIQPDTRELIRLASRLHALPMIRPAPVFDIETAIAWHCERGETRAGAIGSIAEQLRSVVIK